MHTRYYRSELQELPTIEQAWDGDELKIQESDYKVWLTNRENVQWNGHYTVERLVDGKWIGESYYFNR